MFCPMADNPLLVAKLLTWVEETNVKSVIAPRSPNLSAQLFIHGIDRSGFYRIVLLGKLSALKARH